MRRTYLSILFLLVIVVWFGACDSDRKNDRPNILLILSDQQHWQAMGHMDPFFDTPHLDAFAKKSTVFESAFCTTPQCSPSRSSLMTGFYPGKTRVFGNMGASGGNPLDQHTIAPELQKADYYTAYFGKWHLGDKEIALDGWNEKVIKQNDSLAEKNAVHFLRKRGQSGQPGQPFALFVSFVNPHDIYKFKEYEPGPDVDRIPLPLSWEEETFRDKPSVQKQFMLEDQGKVIEGKPRLEWQKYRACYRAKVKLYDNRAGAILNELKRQGLWDNTIVIITSDHGDMDTNHRLIFKGPFMYEHLTRIPLMIHVPVRFGGMQPRRIKDVDVVNVDIVPTIRELCNLPAQETDGISLVPLLTEKGKYKERDFVTGQYYGKQKWVTPIRMIRTRRYKLNKYTGYRYELYDLQNDPYELKNLVDDPGYGEIKEELSKKLDEWMSNNDDPFYAQKPTDRSGAPLE